VTDTTSKDARAEMPEAFGPTQRYMSDGRSVHRRGMQEHIPLEGSAAPPFDPKRLIPDRTIAERFQERFAEQNRKT
jgi:hypothetical protein